MYGYIEDIYFFDVNTKYIWYISSNVLKISVISRVRSTSETADISNTFDKIYQIYLPKKSKIFFLFFPLRGKHFFLSHFSLILLGSACLVGIILGANRGAPTKVCKMSF